jgi:hypothetical protein
VCAACQAEALPIAAEGFEGIRALLERPLAEAGGAGVSERGRRDALRVVESSYEYHGGFRLRTLAQRPSDRTVPCPVAVDDPSHIRHGSGTDPRAVPRYAGP